MNDIFDGSATDAVDRGHPGAGRRSASSSTTCSTTTARTSSRRPTTATSRATQGASYGNPEFVGPVGAGLDATARELRAPAELAGDRRGPERDRAARRRQRHLPGHGPVALERPGHRHPHEPGHAARRTRSRARRTSSASSATSSFTQLQRDLGFVRFAADRHPAGLGLLQLPRPVAAGPDRHDPTATPAPLPTPTPTTTSPITGVRDILGYIRVPDPDVPGVGYGSNPFIDIGAYQYVNLHPPQVTAVTATETSTSSASGTTTVPFYTVGGEAGSNQHPADDQRHLQRADRPRDAHRQHRPARGAGHRPGHDPAVHQPRRQAVLQQRDQHAGHQPRRQPA